MIENRIVGVFLSVLIVAKCNVNKYLMLFQFSQPAVLIVAKCNVNMLQNRKIGVFLSY